MAPDRELTEVDISRLAREIARDLRPLEVILDKMNIDTAQYEAIRDNHIFQARMVEEASIWAGTTRQTLRERVASKAAIAIEELLEDAIGIVRNGDIPGAARVQALQFIAKLGQLGDNALAVDDGSGRVQINIMIGGQKIVFDKEVPERGPMLEGEVITSEVNA